MRLTVIGCSGSFPGPDGPASCYLVEAGGTRVLLDLGSGALGPLQRHVALEDLDAVLLSHLHPDHFLDLCGTYVALRYRPGGSPPRRLAVHGPHGTRQRLASAYGTSPAELERVMSFATWSPGQPGRVGELLVEVVRVEHPVEAYAVRVEHDGAVLVYSGDTSACPALVDLARDADLLLCEAAFHEGRDDAIAGLHLTGRGAGEHAAAAGARRLVLTHLPPWNDPQRAVEEARSAYDGPLEVARAGATYDVARVAP